MSADVLAELDALLDEEEEQGGKRKREEEEAEVCVICQDEISFPCGSLPCRHAFCYDCISQWTKRSNVCPVCKRRFSRLKKLNEDGKVLLTRKIRKKDFDDWGNEIDSDDFLSGDEDGVCMTCGAEDYPEKLLFCDYPGCPHLQHSYCCIPAVHDPPETGDFFCSSCVEEHSLPGNFTAPIVEHQNETDIFDEALHACVAAPLPPPRPSTPESVPNPDEAEAATLQQSEASSGRVLADLPPLPGYDDDDDDDDDDEEEAVGVPPPDSLASAQQPTLMALIPPPQPRVNRGSFMPPLIPEVEGPLIPPPPPRNPNAQEGMMHLIKPPSEKAILRAEPVVGQPKSMAELRLRWNSMQPLLQAQARAPGAQLRTVTAIREERLNRRRAREQRANPTVVSKTVGDPEGALRSREAAAPGVVPMRRSLSASEWCERFAKKEKDVPSPAPSAPPPKQAPKPEASSSCNSDAESAQETQPMQMQEAELQRMDALLQSLRLEIRQRREKQGSRSKTGPPQLTRRSAPSEPAAKKPARVHSTTTHPVDSPFQRGGGGDDQKRARASRRRPLSQIYTARATLAAALCVTAVAKAALEEAAQQRRARLSSAPVVSSKMVKGVYVPTAARNAVLLAVKEVLKPLYADKVVSKDQFKSVAAESVQLFIAMVVDKHRDELRRNPDNILSILAQAKHVKKLVACVETQVKKCVDTSRRFPAGNVALEAAKARLLQLSKGG
ncbi:PHD and RING finger domain-containing protein [Diplonema papillatum]|nr:PHD and RING finger domain-containing protein [Diplonema papillatum]